MAVARDKRRTYEARIWRLAYLLTGTTSHATSVVTSVARAQRRLLDLDPTHLDRLVVLHAREYDASGATSAIDALASLIGKAWRSIRAPQGESSEPDRPEHEVPPEAARLLEHVIEMDHQPREAWVLGRIDGVGEMWMARAMDCSKTATAMHLEAADRHIAKLYEDGDSLEDAIKALREHVDSLDPLPIIEQPKLARRRAWMIVLIVAGVGALAIGSLILAQL